MQADTKDSLTTFSKTCRPKEELVPPKTEREEKAGVLVHRVQPMGLLKEMLTLKEVQQEVKSLQGVSFIAQ